MRCCDSYLLDGTNPQFSQMWWAFTGEGGVLAEVMYVLLFIMTLTSKLSH